MIDKNFLDGIFTIVQKAKVEKRKLTPEEVNAILSNDGPWATHVREQMKLDRREREFYVDENGGCVVYLKIEAKLVKVKVKDKKTGKMVEREIAKNKPKVCSNGAWQIWGVKFPLVGELVGYTMFAEAKSIFEQIGFGGGAIAYGTMTHKYKPQDSSYTAKKDLWASEFLKWLKAQGDVYASIEDVPKALYYDAYTFNHWETLKVIK